MASQDSSSSNPDVVGGLPKSGKMDTVDKFGEPDRRASRADNANDLLENLGYTPELARTRSTAQVAFMSFVLAAIPYGLATSLYYPLVGGGPVDIIWGWVGVSMIIVCVAVSLGEITSIYPTAGGVYYQAFMLSPPRWRRVASWICGWLYVVGNITITLAVNFGSALFIVSCVNVYESSPGVGIFAGKPYQVYLIFLGITLLCNAVSSLGNKWLPWLDTASIYWTFAGMLAIIVCILVMAKGGRHDAKYVFTHFEVSSGWPDGWSFCVGLLHAGYATSSTGMIISMCEEVMEPSIQVPKAMVITVLINTVAGLVMLIPLVFVLPDIQMLVSLASAQPVPTIIRDAVGSPGGAIGLLMPLIVLAIICGIGCTTAASRCTWAFARDGAIPGAKRWMAIDKRLDIPLNAMMLSMAVQLILGLIYFGSSAAFNAFSGVGVICLTAAYATPIAISLATGRKQVKNGLYYKGTLGLVCNIIALAWSAFAIPLFCFPSVIPVQATTINYAPVVFVAACLVSGIWYWVWGFDNYAGPPTNEDE
ncbi:Amino acid transporter [Geosmithia morbida]|uniref:Amino acid transporter n=1 Tax=Geosmithia morbida TaxID=1094350 RepID=A0A9P4YMQ4_9HYPO|nr:Amino acid transporter [Geosmithia morbida]KAF4119415.1 Amino acid transporter [Geosmithia morbida]